MAGGIGGHQQPVKPWEPSKKIVLGRKALSLPHDPPIPLLDIYLRKMKPGVHAKIILGC